MENVSSEAKEAAAPRTWGLLAEYRDVGSLLRAAEAVREAGYSRWDCCTPFPVHGLDRAMGMRRTILPWIVLGGGLAGLTGALLLQWWVNSPYTESASLGVVSGFPLVISGKPYWSPPANVPIIFELSVLVAALTAFFSLWAICRLPRLYHPAFGSAGSAKSPTTVSSSSSRRRTKSLTRPAPRSCSWEPTAAPWRN